MNAPTTVYEYEILRNPTQDDVNRLAAQGWRVHKMALDPRDGSLAVIIMERGGMAYEVKAGQREYTADEIEQAAAVFSAMDREVPPGKMNKRGRN